MKKIHFLFINFIIVNSSVFAAQNIEIVGGNKADNPKIAVMNFESNQVDDNRIAHIIANDLNITGEFNVKEYNNINQVESDVQYIINGKLQETPDKQLMFNYQLLPNTKTKAPIVTHNLKFLAKDVRNAAHITSNTVYKQLTNVPGIFTTKIAYVIKNHHEFEVVVSDYDGYNPITIFSSKQPISSLVWNSNGQQIAYVSFELNKPVVYVQNLYLPKERYAIANFPSNNSSPSFTPDNKKLAVTLSKDGNSNIYLVDNSPYTHDKKSELLVEFGSIATEADISKSGKITFTSNRDGGPQVFMKDLDPQSLPIRITNNMGNYNTTPRFSHDGTKITFINKNNSILKTYVMDLLTKSAYPISLNTSSDIAPSFAPNDKLILFSSKNNLYIANITGTHVAKLNLIKTGEIIDQRWANNF